MVMCCSESCRGLVLVLLCRQHFDVNWDKQFYRIQVTQSVLPIKHTVFFNAKLMCGRLWAIDISMVWQGLLFYQPTHSWAERLICQSVSLLCLVVDGYIRSNMGKGDKFQCTKTDLGTGGRSCPICPLLWKTCWAPPVPSTQHQTGEGLRHCAESEVLLTGKGL